MPDEELDPLLQRRASKSVEDIIREYEEQRKLSSEYAELEQAVYGSGETHTAAGTPPMAGTPPIVAYDDAHQQQPSTSEGKAAEHKVLVDVLELLNSQIVMFATVYKAELVRNAVLRVAVVALIWSFAFRYVGRPLFFTGLAIYLFMEVAHTWHCYQRASRL